MKFKKTLSVILSAATILNLCYPCLASAKTTAANTKNSVSVTQNTEENGLTNRDVTTESKIVTQKDSKNSAKSDEVEK